MDKNNYTFYDVTVILSAEEDLVKGCGQAGSTQAAALVGEVDAHRIGQRRVDSRSELLDAVVCDVVSSHRILFFAFASLDRC
jgi:hypothetical protein